MSESVLEVLKQRVSGMSPEAAALVDSVRTHSDQEAHESALETLDAVGENIERNNARKRLTRDQKIRLNGLNERVGDIIADNLEMRTKRMRRERRV